jgi:hypothetical protein
MLLKWGLIGYAAAILLVGGVVTALTAPKHEEEEQKAREQAIKAQRAKQPPPEMTPAAQVVERVEEIRGVQFEGGAPKLEMAPEKQLQTQLTTLDTQAKSQTKGADKQRDQQLEQGTQMFLAQTGALSTKELQQATKQYSGARPLGLYIPQQKKILVSKEVGDSDPQLAELVFVHQLGRALESEQFGETALNARPFRDDESAELALQEGTATLTETEYATRHLGASEPVEPTTADLTVRNASPETPPALRALQTFAPASGSEYVAALHEEGGWDAVNAAHNDQPTTTREILHPEAREQGDPEAQPTPPLERALGSGWQQQAAAALGELDTIVLLGGSVGAAQARQAADGWSAGRFEVWGKGQAAQSCPPPCRKQTVSVGVWQWAQPSDAQEFERAMRRSLQRGAGGRPGEEEGTFAFKDGAGALTTSGTTTALVFAPDAAQATSVAEAALQD